MLNLFDIGIILLLISFIIVGFKKGVIKELVALVGIIIVFILSWTLKGYLGNILCIYLPFYEFKGIIYGMSTLNIFIYQIIAFMIIFSLLLGFYSFSLTLSKVIQKVVNLTIVLWIPSKILGALVSFIKGYLVLFVVFILLLIPLGKYDIYKESTFINFMLYKTPILSKCTSNFIKPLTDISSLAEEVKDKEISVNEANLKAIDIMLEYNIIDKETLIKINDKGKLTNVEGIENIINK